MFKNDAQTVVGLFAESVFGNDLSKWSNLCVPPWYISGVNIKFLLVARRACILAWQVALDLVGTHKFIWLCRDEATKAAGITATTKINSGYYTSWLNIANHLQTRHAEKQILLQVKALTWVMSNWRHPIETYYQTTWSRPVHTPQKTNGWSCTWFLRSCPIFPRILEGPGSVLLALRLSLTKATTWKSWQQNGFVESVQSFNQSLGL